MSSKTTLAPEGWCGFNWGLGKDNEMGGNWEFFQGREEGLEGKWRACRVCAEMEEFESSCGSGGWASCAYWPVIEFTSNDRRLGFGKGLIWPSTRRGFVIKFLGCTVKFVPLILLLWYQLVTQIMGKLKMGC